MDYDVIIVGAGPGGIFAAYELTKEDNGLKVAVFEAGKKLEERKCPIDGVKIKKTSQLLDNVYIVIFSPDDLKIVKDEPEKRRKFIDKELCQIKPSYYDNLSNYKKVQTL